MKNKINFNFKTKFPAPAGFSIEVTPQKRCHCPSCKSCPPSYYVYLFDENYTDQYNKVPTRMQVGSINLCFTKKINGRLKYETHSQLNPPYQNKGLGLLIYQRAIEFCLMNGYRISSSCSPSLMAQRLWKSRKLRSNFKVRKIKNYTFCYQK
jgi:GNAT superfamily N-acetyltransferase